MSLSGPVLAALLGAGGLGAIIAAIISGVFAKRKLGAEATEIITKAAAGVVTNLNDEVARLLKALEQRDVEHKAAMTATVAAHGREITRMREAQQEHVAWDFIVVKKCEAAGIALPPPPALLPPPVDEGHEEVH